MLKPPQRNMYHRVMCDMCRMFFGLNRTERWLCCKLIQMSPYGTISLQWWANIVHAAQYKWWKHTHCVHLMVLSSICQLVIDTAMAGLSVFQWTVQLKNEWMITKYGAFTVEWATYYRPIVKVKNETTQWHVTYCFPTTRWKLQLKEKASEALFRRVVVLNQHCW